MCSILFTDKKIKDFEDVNFFLRFRGPDNTEIVEDETNGFTFVHNLLSITGEFTSQPFIEDGIVFLFNGEIYNFKDFGDYDSDGYCIIDLYKEHGIDFVKKLDGEFAIFLLDLNEDLVIIATDPFKTKPLFYSISEDSFGCSTYRTALDRIGHENVKRVKPNTCSVYKLSSYEKVDEFTIVNFDLNQHKDNFDDWDIAFKNAIRKRTSNTDKKIFMGLSSGYDSGAIACELLKQEVPFKAYSVVGRGDWKNIEDMDVLNFRHNKINKSQFAEVENLYKSAETREFHRNFIKTHSENFKWTINTSASNYTENWNLCDDRGSAWISLICSEARKESRKIYLSGQGADEIFADYGFNGQRFAQHSNFSGKFPEDLSTIFPWNSFYYSSQESYIAKEEYTSGIYGIETRYPFLDKQVVQEFLWLTPQLKNSQYKSVLDNYFMENKFAFSRGKKIGF
jgi:asparagine synthetase B (glutamine-hydrolysing)